MSIIKFECAERFCPNADSRELHLSRLLSDAEIAAFLNWSEPRAAADYWHDHEEIYIGCDAQWLEELRAWLNSLGDQSI